MALLLSQPDKYIPQAITSNTNRWANIFQQAELQARKILRLLDKYRDFPADHHQDCNYHLKFDK